MSSVGRLRLANGRIETAAADDMLHSTPRVLLHVALIVGLGLVAGGLALALPAAPQAEWPLAIGGVIAGSGLIGRRRAEHAASEARYRARVERSPEAILAIDPAGRIVEANPAACTLVGYARADLLGRSEDEFVAHGPDRASKRSLMRDGQIVRFERLLLRRDGSLVPVEISARLRPDGQIHVVVRDIAGRVATELERDRLVAAVEQVNESIVLTDADGRVIYANPAFGRVHRMDPDEILGRRTGELVKSDVHDPSFYDRIESDMASGKGWSGRITNRRGDGGLVELDLLITPRRDADGAFAGWIEVGRDVGPEAALEAQLRHAVKMEAMGTLAGGIAHDFNNLLTGIRGFAELHLGLHPSPDHGRVDLEQIIKASDRGAELTRRLLEFSRKGSEHLQPVDLAGLIRSSERLLRRLLGDDVEVAMRLSRVPSVLADAGQIEGVLLNLAANSRDAMPAGGALTVTVDTVDLDEAFVASHSGLHAGRHVEISVSDTGCGMDETARVHAFEPFFTTKEPGKGTGLGLASVYGIVMQAGGHVSIESVRGEGTTVRIYLPCLERPAAPLPHTPRAHCQHTPTHDRVLLVEDEPAVRSFAQRALELHGYRVLAYGNPEAALQAAVSGNVAYDVLVTDVVMPRLNGHVLALRLAEMRQGLPVLFISAHEGAVAAEASRGHRLAKPFGACELAEAVTAVLAEQSVAVALKLPARAPHSRG